MSNSVKAISAAVLALAISFAGLSPSQAQPKQFKSCSALNTVYKGGITKHPQLVFESAELQIQPRFKSGIYKANRKLDFDKDGILCEKTVVDVAHREIKVALRTSSKVEESLLVVRSGPSLSSADLVDVRKSVLTSMSLFSRTFPVLAVNATWFTAEDVDWVDSAIAEAGGFPRNYSSNLRNFANQCNMGNAGVGDNGPYINQCLGPSGAPAHHNSETAAHEYFHTLQYSSMGGQRLPFWFLEGAATFVGLHVGGHSFGDFATSRKLTLGRYASRGLDRAAREAVTKSDVSAIENRLVALQNSNPEPGIRQSAYVFGMLLNEKLIAEFGYERWTSLLLALKNSAMEQAFIETYKVELGDYYSRSAPYIVSQLKPLILGN